MNLIDFNRQLIFNKILYKNSLLASAQKKRNVLNTTQVCNLKNWIKETLSLSKAREVITENILLLKYQIQAITAALNGQYN